VAAGRWLLAGGRWPERWPEPIGDDAPVARTRIPDAEGMAAVRACIERAEGQPGQPRQPGQPAQPVQPVQPDRATQRTAVKYALQALTDRAPGYSVEVRIPPFAAVQAVAGPTHRRGTPSAVVEMDADTWLALTTGQVTWDAVRSAGRMRASGQRADLSPWLPLLHV
jgi:mRNA-degrading endonuclease toxin of MazEF toxin-antitoxin module